MGQFIVVTLTTFFFILDKNIKRMILVINVVKATDDVVYKFYNNWASGFILV